jgi:hypothetical protein
MPSTLPQPPENFARGPRKSPAGNSETPKLLSLRGERLGAPASGAGWPPATRGEARRPPRSTRPLLSRQGSHESETAFTPRRRPRRPPTPPRTAGWTTFTFATTPQTSARVARLSERIAGRAPLAPGGRSRPTSRASQPRNVLRTRPRRSTRLRSRDSASQRTGQPGSSEKTA